MKALTDRRLHNQIDTNLILYGDNLLWMKKIPDEFVDLIYLDPPFNSKKAYNITFESDRSKAQVKAFDDTWHWSPETQKTYDQLAGGGNKTTSQIIKAIISFHDMLGNNNQMAYLVMMTPRLMEMHRILKDNGSIYLHCDSTASHYLKVIMDAIFGIRNFRNEIIWHYHTGGASKQHFSKKHDIIFFYSRGSNYKFNTQKEPYREEKTDHFTNIDQNDRKYRIRKINGKEYKYYLDEGRICHDVWDIPAIDAVAKERTPWPTQKPLALLERIIKASCPHNGTVFDPFCGCGTALISAEKLNRKWIGIDITYLAIEVLKNRIQKELGNFEDIDFIEDGAPEGMAGVIYMAKRDKKGFEKYIIRKISGVPNENLDKGIDGFLFFKDGDKDETAIIQETVNKSVNPGKVRDFGRTIDREKAPIGIFITLKAPTGGMIEEANTMGVYTDSFGNEYPRMQFLTVRDIIETRKKPDVPQIKSQRGIL